MVKWGGICVSRVMCVLNPWLCVHMSWHTPIFDALPPGHNAYGQEGQHIDGCCGQYECQLWVGQAVGDIVHCQFFLEWVLVRPWQLRRMLGWYASKIPRPYVNEPSFLLPIGRECPILHGIGPKPMHHVTKWRPVASKFTLLVRKQNLDWSVSDRQGFYTVIAASSRNTGVLRDFEFQLSYKKNSRNEQFG